MRRTVLLLAALLLVFLLILAFLPATRPPAPPPPIAPSAPRVPSLAPPPPAVPAPGPVPVPAPPAPPTAMEPGRPGDFRIHGRVVGGGAGVAGAVIEVRAWSGSEPDVKWSVYRAAAGPGGEFSVAADRALCTLGFGIETEADGFLEGWVVLKPADYDEERGVEVPMEPARAILGRVLDEYARPLPKATVQLWYGSETTWPTEADADGRFRTPAKGPRRAFEVIVEVPGHPRRIVPVAAAPGDESTDLGDLVFRRGGRLAGIAVDGAGRPLRDVPLCLTGIAGDSPSTRTDDAGRFEFADLGEGTVGICVGSPGTARDGAGNLRSWRGGLDGAAVGRSDLRVVLAGETTVVLRFVDGATGAPVLVTETEYGAWPTGAAEAGRPGHGGASSTPYGTERMTVPSGARYDFLVRSPGFEDARVEGIDVPDVAEMTVDVPMRRTR